METIKSDTPRTDAKASDGWSGDAWCVSVEDAKEIERELNEAKKEIELCRKQLSMQISDLDLLKENSELKSRAEKAEASCALLFKAASNVVNECAMHDGSCRCASCCAIRECRSLTYDVTQITGQQLLDELERLRKENADLKETIEHAGNVYNGIMEVSGNYVRPKSDAKLVKAKTLQFHLTRQPGI